jgi:hypothetical protein
MRYSRLMNIRWKRWVAGAALLLAVYTLVGFWLVPLVIRSQVPKIGQTELKRQAAIGEVRFNPFTLRLEAQELRLAEADGSPLFAIGKLAVELQWQSLVRRAWRFTEISITAPSANLAIAPDGQFNIAQLLATLERRPHEPAGADSNLPRLVIERFALEQGKVQIDDRRAGYANVVAPIDFAVNNFSTFPEQGDTYTFSADSAKGGKLRWKGEASVNPIRGSGELTLEHASLPELAVYLKPYTRTTLAAGKLFATLPYRFAYADGKLQASLDGAQLALNGLALVDQTATPPIKVSAAKARLQLKLNAEQSGSRFNLTVADSALTADDLVLVSGARTPLKLAQLGFTEGAFDLATQHASVGRLYAQGGQLQINRDHWGQFDYLGLLPNFEAPSRPNAARLHAQPANASTPWVVVARSVELSQFAADVEDQGTAVKVHVQDLAVKLDGASSDLKQPVKFSVGLSLREGGQLSAQGSVVPALGALQADVRVKQLALAPLQPVLANYLKLKIAGGNVSAQGQLATGSGSAKSPALRYAGSFEVAGLVLNEQGGDLFAAWKSVGADKLEARVNPNALLIPEVRVVDPNAKLIIENDRSLNAVRLLVRSAAPAAPTAPASAPPPPRVVQGQTADDPFPVRIRRLRFQNAKLDFTDLSLRPQFGAKIYELNGVITGLSSSRTSRSQIELDGRVDEFGLARIRGELNPFAPRDNTDINVVFKNVDMVSASPYTMKFAGYKIAEGKISLDLQYKVRDSKLDGANQIVIDKLTLGERVDSPDALKLPLELAIAILKDSDGRIDLGLPVSGDLSDPQFSYGAIIWKAIGNVLTKIVTAPFRALGALLGISGEKLESIDFDPGSDRLLPPEREKLKQVAQLLEKRAQLKLSVPGGYSEAADGAALRARAVRVEIAKRAGIKLEAGEEPGPMDLRDRSVRGALRDLYAQRFGDAELDKQKKAAEAAVGVSSSVASAAAPAAAASAAGTGTTQDKLPLWQRMGKLIQGEPQVADASAFYRNLQERLNQTQPLPADALTRLGAQRASAVVAALVEGGSDPSRAVAGAPEPTGSEAGRPVPLKLGLAAK